MASEKLLEFLNKGIALELQVSIQYLWQSIQAKGVDGAVAKEIFRKAAIAEMKHAERLADRLDQLNGMPTTKPEEIHVGDSLIEMLTDDERNEEEAITLYKEAIQLAAKEGDYTTRRLLEEILAEEEDHVGVLSDPIGHVNPFRRGVRRRGAPS